MLTTEEQRERDNEGKLQGFLEYAERHVAQFVNIIVENDTAGLEADQLKLTFVGQGNHAGTIGFIYPVNASNTFCFAYI